MGDVFTGKPTMPPPPPPPPVYTTLSFLLLVLLSLFALLSFYPHNTTTTTTTTTLSTNPSPPSLFLSSANNSTISAFLRRLTLLPHVAGTPQASRLAASFLSTLSAFLPSSHSSPLPALLSFPISSSLNTTSPLSDSGGGGGASASTAVVAPYHAYSPSGVVRGPVLYVNTGSSTDYLALAALGVNVSGCIAIARRGGDAEMSRADVVALAEERGAKAVLMFTSGSEEFPAGVERGTVMRGGVGDPMTPGWSSGAGERLEADDPEVRRRFPKIPSMPISLRVAEGILGSLGGASLPRGWSKSVGSTAVRRVGPGPIILDFSYQGENRVETIYNVFAVIRGSEEPDRYVLLGNHRDAWTYGAVDPNSGTAAMLDIARRFSILMESGWRPRRTIILCSWDAEEFGMIGSTEWVEQNLLNLRSKAVAYLNVDCAVQGPGFFTGVTPQLDNLILEVLQQVNDPDLEGATMFRQWTRNKENTIGRLGRLDSDFVAFVQHAGIPSVDMYYGRDYPVYHTAFDSYDWMKNHGDPLFHRHVAISGVWGLLALRLADDPILPFDYRTYADQLKSYGETLSKLLNGLVSLSHLTTSIQEFASAAKEIEIESRKLGEEKAISEIVVLKRRALNDRLMLAERGFLDSDGLEGRRWFKHLIYGRPSDPESKIDFFPGIADAISRSATMRLKQKKALIQHEIWRVVRAIQRATSALRGDLT